MPLPNAKESLIQQGHKCNVVIYDENNVRMIIGLATNASYNENFSLAEAKGIGFLGAMSVDVQDYSCSITIGTYVPLDPRAAIVVPYIDGGTTTLAQQLKTRSQVALTGKGTVLSQMDFVDLVSGVVYNSFSQCIIESNGVNIAAAAYVTANLSLRCIERTI